MCPRRPLRVVGRLDRCQQQIDTAASRDEVGAIEATHPERFSVGSIGEHSSVLQVSP